MKIEQAIPNSCLDELELRQQETNDFEVMRSSENKLITDMLLMITLASEGISPRNEEEFKRVRAEIINGFSTYHRAYRQFKQLNSQRINDKHQKGNNPYGRKFRGN